MADEPKTFGTYISDRRKKMGLSQKQLSELIVREEGGTISPQYLNDIEHDPGVRAGSESWNRPPLLSRGSCTGGRPGRQPSVAAGGGVVCGFSPNRAAHEERIGLCAL